MVGRPAVHSKTQSLPCNVLLQHPQRDCAIVQATVHTAAQVSTMQEQVLAFQAQAKKLPKVSFPTCGCRSPGSMLSVF